MGVGKVFKSMLRLGLLFGLFAAIVVLSSYAVIRVVVRGGEVVKVPNVVNDNFVSAWEKLEEAGLRIEKATKQHNPVVPENHIISQKPAADSKVKKGRVVNVTISMGREMLPVPDVTRENRRRAQSMLTNEHLAVGHVSEIHYPSREGLVVGQDPQPGASIESGGKVNLLVSLGPRLDKYLVPDVVGMKIDAAVQLVSQLNLQVQQKMEVRPQMTPGMVLTQDPPTNEIIEEGSAVLVTVSTRSEEKRWENMRYMVLTFEMPHGFRKRLVRIEMSDALGTETVFRRLLTPFTIITLPVSYKVNSDMKMARVRVFVGDVLHQETKLDASGVITTMYTQPWRDIYETEDSAIAVVSGLR